MPKKVLDELDARALTVSLKEAAKQQFDVSFEKAHSMRCITFLAICLTVSSMAQNWALIDQAVNS